MTDNDLLIFFCNLISGSLGGGWVGGSVGSEEASASSSRDVLSSGRPPHRERN